MMRLGILTRNERGWESSQIILAARKKEIAIEAFSFSNIIARISYMPQVSVNRKISDLAEFDAIIVRPIGRGSLDEIIFRLDLLHRLERLGIKIINPPSAIEKAVDKYYALTLLEENDIPVPRTFVTENPSAALDAFYELGEDVVIKPIFGSRGIGITRITDSDVFDRICRTLSFAHHVLYIQEFIPHRNRDIRAFVIGDRVLASMLRVSDNWKTNVSKGAEPKPYEPDSKLEKIALKSSRILCCEVAGVDIIEGPEGYLVNEINSQPGFRGLQSVTKVNIAEEIVEYSLEMCKK